MDGEKPKQIINIKIFNYQMMPTASIDDTFYIYFHFRCENGDDDSE